MKIFEEVSNRLINELFFNSRIYKLLIKIFKKVAYKGLGSNECLKEGFLPVPVHYYSPIPDIKDLEKRKVWDKKSKLIGINFNQKNQLLLLKKLGQKFGQECVWPFEPTANPVDFFLNNQNFSYGCAAALHSMVREFKPRTIIEIGSGDSSKIISQALAANKKENNKKATYVVIDPYPIGHVSFLKIDKYFKKRVELVNPNYFDKLGKNDILFIDSSHSVKIGSDVNFLYLDILPRLKPGVIVHIHDIGLPYEYPKAYATNEVFRQFWTEQYLLQSFLIFNHDFEILLPMAYIMTDHLSKFKAAFPIYNPAVHKYISHSFWVRRKINANTSCSNELTKTGILASSEAKLKEKTIHFTKGV